MIDIKMMLDLKHVKEQTEEICLESVKQNILCLQYLKKNRRNMF